MAKRLDPALLQGYGKQMTIMGKAFAVGLQKDPKTFTRVTGLIRSQRDGQVIENLDLRGGSIEVNHKNVVIRNVILDATGPGWHAIYQLGNGGDMLVELSLFDGGKMNTRLADFIYTENPKDAGGKIIKSRIERNVLFNAPADMYNSSGGTIIGNVMIGSGYQPGAHADAISIHSGGPLEIAYNYIDNITPPDAAIPDTNACLKIVNHWAPPIQGVNAHHNVLLGGGFNIYCSGGATIQDNLVGMGHWGVFYTSGGKSDESNANAARNTPYANAPENVVAISTNNIPIDPPVDPPPPQPAGKPVNQGPPTIIGGTEVGREALTASGKWADVQPDWKWEWAWNLNGVKIPGATTWRYTPVKSGKLTVDVLVTNKEGITTVASSPAITVMGTDMPPVDPPPVEPPPVDPPPAEKPVLTLDQGEVDKLVGALEDIIQMLSEDDD